METQRPMEHSRDPRSKPVHLQPTYSQQMCQNVHGKGTVSSINVGKTG